jgi:hypothetical protein
MLDGVAFALYPLLLDDGSMNPLHRPWRSEHGCGLYSKINGYLTEDIAF